jgi:hypothetical protein
VEHRDGGEHLVGHQPRVASHAHVRPVHGQPVADAFARQPTSPRNRGEVKTARAAGEGPQLKTSPRGSGAPQFTPAVSALRTCRGHSNWHNAAPAASSSSSRTSASDLLLSSRRPEAISKAVS